MPWEKQIKDYKLSSEHSETKWVITYAIFENSFYLWKWIRLVEQIYIPIDGNIWLFDEISLFYSLWNQMIIVDTPGTNVILQRQQRLTEEFVPRADLVLFVISADRPLTESEV